MGKEMADNLANRLGIAKNKAKYSGVKVYAADGALLAAFDADGKLKEGSDVVSRGMASGKINEADGRVTTVFEFTNEGMVPLVLTNVRASCGCTTPKWTREPIEPGQKGNITVTYNPNGRPGRFQKTVTITSNATEPTQRHISAPTTNTVAWTSPQIPHR